MKTGEILGIHHLKVPVTDLGRSREFYERVFDLQLLLEFPDADGTVRGVAYVPKGGFSWALRENPDAAKGLAGFDPFSILVKDKPDLEAWVARLDELGVAHSPIVQATIGWILSFEDPDGLELRLYSAAVHDGAAEAFS